MSQSKLKPIYFLQPGDPAVEAWRQTFEEVISMKTKSFTFEVPPGVVESRDVSLAHEFILALQHYPQFIERMLFSMDFKFQQIADSELYLQEMDWKLDPKYYRWFRRMGENPLSLFFINDSDARFYMLAGDLLADGKLPAVKQMPGGKKAKIAISPEHAAVMSRRLFDSCSYFHIYCHGSGFDPRTYIESILADYSLPVHYEQIQKQYIKDIKDGVKFWAKGEKSIDNPN